MPFDGPLGPMSQYEKAGLWADVLIVIRVVGRVDFVGVLRFVVNGGDTRLSEVLTIQSLTLLPGRVFSKGTLASARRLSRCEPLC